jgi:salicylate hydroxylase
LKSEPIMRIAVVGCGVAGAVLAHLLSRHSSLQVRCFERALPDDQAGSGTGLNIGPNALKALAACDPLMVERIHAAGYPWKRWSAATTDGRSIFDFPLSELADNPGVRVRWSELYRVVRETVLEQTCFGAQVTRCDFDESLQAAEQSHKTLFVEYIDAAGCVRRETGFDLVVSADGRYSELRTQFAGALEPRHVGVAIYRLLVPDTSGGLIDDYAWWFRDAKRLLCFRVPPEMVYISGSFPIPVGEDIPAHLQTPAALAKHYVPSQGQACPAVQWMVDQLLAYHSQIHWARLQESAPLFHGACRQVLFLGDAAHGMVPTLGQGATQAMEDACAAAQVIAQACARRTTSVHSLDVAAITEAVAKARMRRVQWVMDFSMDATSALLEGKDSVAEMQRLRKPEYQAMFRRLWTDVGII